MQQYELPAGHEFIPTLGHNNNCLLYSISDEPGKLNVKINGVEINMFNTLRGLGRHIYGKSSEHDPSLETIKTLMSQTALLEPDARLISNMSKYLKRSIYVFRTNSNINGLTRFALYKGDDASKEPVVIENTGQFHFQRVVLSDAVRKLIEEIPINLPGVNVDLKESLTEKQDQEEANKHATEEKKEILSIIYNFSPTLHMKVVNHFLQGAGFVEDAEKAHEVYKQLFEKIDGEDKVAPDRIKRVAVNLFKNRRIDHNIRELQKEYEDMIFDLASGVVGKEESSVKTVRQSHPTQTKIGFIRKEMIFGLLLIILIVIVVVVSLTRTSNKPPTTNPTNPTDTVPTSNPFFPRFPDIPSPFDPLDPASSASKRSFKYYATIVLSVLVFIEIIFLILFLIRSIIKKQN